MTYDEAAVKCADAEIIINTTPVGMYPNIGAKPIDIPLFPRLCGVADAIYNPLRSELISDAAECGIPCSGGLYMLAAQAVYARALFLGEEADESLIGKAYLGTKLQKQNIVLIGMPSSGKSTVGGLLAESEGREFIDTDLLIAERAGKSIPEIFAAEGESGFRKLESEVIADVAAKSGRVIATGGGSVLNPANVCKLKQNGVLVFLDRRPELLCGTADRPLSQNTEAMARLYEQRYPIYTASADITVDSNGTVGEAAELIKRSCKMKFLILNGPNINILGIREPDIYGRQTYDDLIKLIKRHAEELGIEVEFVQSNHEGDLVDAIQNAYFSHTDGIVFNPAAYTHTSVAIADAVKGVGIPTVEVHISDVSKRESFRQVSYISAAAVKTIAGQGLDGYNQALDFLTDLVRNEK